MTKPTHLIVTPKGSWPRTAYVLGLIARIEQQQAERDARDWALGRIAGLLIDLDRPLKGHEREILKTAQMALSAEPQGFDR